MNDNPLPRLGWIVRIIVYVMLLASAAAAFLLGDTLWRAARSGEVPLWAALAPAASFTAFVVVYAIDRLLLLRRRRFPPGRALFQIALAILFLGMLWPQQAAELRRAKHDSGALALMPRLLAHREAEVRAAACELAGLKAELDLRARVAALAQQDGSAVVRTACTQALARIDRQEDEEDALAAP